jgi:Histidine kinase-, DNA gyrase B-, and HSP90-like ATPase
MQVRLFEDANALDSLRNSDFDAVSAYGEVIDNSIQADAHNIRILFQNDGANHDHIACVVFGDDGCGMNAPTLHSCLKIGWSSRYNERGGIGRFGVGMTMAAIHECKRIEVFSKQSGSPWLRTYIDLDEVARGNMDAIPDPAPARLPQEYEHLAGKEAGTVVIWSKYDRQSSSLNVLRRDADCWIGRTFRYFIWEGINISVDGEVVKAIDPLYSRTDKTRFPDDPKARVFDDIVFNWPVDQHDAPPGSPVEAPIRIRMSLLPEELRPEQGSGGSAEAKARFIDQNEGVSILRNRREVFYGPIPYWKAAGPGWPQFEDKDRWWGCEISFDAVLDRAFTVKNIKRGAEPVRQLKATIKSEIFPTRHKCLEEVDRVWEVAKQRKRIERLSTVEAEGVDRLADHLPAEQVAKATPTDKSELDRAKDFESEANRYVNQARNNASEQEKAAYVALFSSQPFTILETTWKGPNFIDASHLGGRSVIEYNMSHPFFAHVYRLLDSLHDGRGGDPYEVSLQLKAMIDLLIIAYAKSEAKFAPDADMSAEQFVENIRVNWGQYLQSYLRTWEKEKNSGAI